jgi:Rod binding domain-containing protein
MNISDLPYGFSNLLRPEVSKNDPAAVKKVAREAEELFAYELVKVMRESTHQEGLGGDMYSSFFDTELARLLAERGLGLSDVIERGLSRLQGFGQEERESPAPKASRAPGEEDGGVGGRMPDAGPPGGR